jgi:calcium-dependent protein kinase
VFEAINKETQEAVAVKIVEKEDLVNIQRVHREVDIMKKCDHPNIVKLIETFEDNERIYLVMELYYADFFLFESL